MIGMKKIFQSFKVVFVAFLVGVAFVATFSYAMFQGGFVSWFLFYSFLPFLLYVLGLFIYPLAGFEVTRHMNQTSYQAGDSLHCTITLRRRTRFPLFFLIVEDILPAHLSNRYEQHISKRMVYPFFKREISIEYTLEHLPRGEQSFSEVRIYTSDLLGLLNKEAYFSGHTQFLVYPHMVKVRNHSLMMDFETGGLSTPFRVHRENALVSGTREYEPGDRVSWIDWKSSAKKNTLISKEYDSQQSNQMVVVFDGIREGGFENRVITAASLMNAYRKENSQIGFVSIGYQDESVRSIQSDHDLYNVLYHLAKVQPDSTKTFVNELSAAFLRYRDVPIFMVVTYSVDQTLSRLIQTMLRPSMHVWVLVVKEGSERLEAEEVSAIYSLEKRNCVVKVIYPEELSKGFLEVGK